MKKFLIIAIMLSTINLFASGTLTLGYSFLNSSDLVKDRPLVGFYVLEPITKNWEYQSWTGTRFDSWFSTDHFIMRNLNDMFKVGLGVGYERLSTTTNNISWGKDSTSVNNTSVKAIVEIKLW